MPGPLAKSSCTGTRRACCRGSGRTASASIPGRCSATGSQRSGWKTAHGPFFIPERFEAGSRLGAFGGQSAQPLAESFAARFPGAPRLAPRNELSRKTLRLLARLLGVFLDFVLGRSEIRHPGRDRIDPVPGIVRFGRSSGAISVLRLLPVLLFMRRLLLRQLLSRLDRHAFDQDLLDDSNLRWRRHALRSCDGKDLRGEPAELAAEQTALLRTRAGALEFLLRLREFRAQALALGEGARVGLAQSAQGADAAAFKCCAQAIDVRPLIVQGRARCLEGIGLGRNRGAELRIDRFELGKSLLCGFEPAVEIGKAALDGLLEHAVCVLVFLQLGPRRGEVSVEG